MKKKKDLTILEKIESIHNELKEITVESGIQLPQYNFPLKKLEKRSIEYQEQLYNWFLGFKNNGYKDVKSLLNQFSGWKMAKVFGINHLPEQVLLRKREKLLRAAWFQWPRIPKKIRIKMNCNKCDKEFTFILGQITICSKCLKKKN